jgi:hypothetical protein
MVQHESNDRSSDNPMKATAAAKNHANWPMLIPMAILNLQQLVCKTRTQFNTQLLFVFACNLTNTDNAFWLFVSSSTPAVNRCAINTDIDYNGGHMFQNALGTMWLHP